MNLTDFIRDVPDFPKPGILFKDITPLLQNKAALEFVIKAMAEHFRSLGIQKVCGIESRGFIFGVPLALELGVGFIPIRKEGKLPHTTMAQEYSLEYGTDKVEIHIDAVAAGEKVLLVDDLLATGGTAKASVDLLEKIDANVVGVCFLIELGFLNGRDLLSGPEVFSLIRYND